MLFAAQTKAVNTADIKHIAIDRVVAIGAGMAAHGLVGDLRQANAFNRCGGAGEIFFDKAAGKANRIKNLRAAIGLIGRNAHFGHDLQNAFANRLDVIFLHLLRGEGQALADPDFFERFKRQIGVDRLGPVASQHTEMVDFAGFAGFDDQPGLHPQAPADEMMMDRRCCQKRWHGNPVWPLRAV